MSIGHWALWGVAAAASPAEPDGGAALVPAFEAELQRSLGALALPGAPPIYHLRYRWTWAEALRVEAEGGALIAERHTPIRRFAAEVRLGSPAFDNTGFGGWEDGFQRAWLPELASPAAARVIAWRATDTAYKQAVEQIARKTAQFTPPPEYPGDYTLTGPARFDEGAGPALDPAALRALALQVSAPLARPDLRDGRAVVQAETGALWQIDSEGSRGRHAVGEVVVQAYAEVQLPDGLLVTDQRLWTASSLADLPPPAALERASAEMGSALAALTDAAPLSEEVVGPVIFEGDAALALIRGLLVRQLEGTPPEATFDSWFGELGAAGGGVRVGRRVLPPGWSAIDDPSADRGAPWSHGVDLEGTPAHPVALVEDGIARRLLLSRVPRVGQSESTGSAREGFGERAVARAARLEVRAPRAVSSERLVREGLALAADYGRDWILIVRRLEEPALLPTGFYPDEGGPLPPPVHWVRRYADGREEPLRGGSFSGVQRWLLRDIVAAGPQRSGAYLAAEGDSDARYGRQPASGLVTWLSAPDVLIGEVEVVPRSGDPDDLPAYPAPALASAPAPR